MGLSDDQVQEIERRAANGWLSRASIDSTAVGEHSIGRMPQMRAARLIQERSTQQARADIAVLIQERSQLLKQIAKLETALRNAR
jgi:multidrug resistance efflux pump